MDFRELYNRENLDAATYACVNDRLYALVDGKWVDITDLE